MFIYNNGVRLGIYNDGTVGFVGKKYHDSKQERLKSIEEKLSLFLDSRGEIDYNGLPLGLKNRINGALSAVYDKLDENADEGVVGRNHLRAFGFMAEDRERVKRAAKGMNLVAYQMGLGSFEAAYEKFKERERLKDGVSIKKESAEFIDNFAISKDEGYTFDFFKSELHRLGMSHHEIIKEYNSLLLMNNRLSVFEAMDKSVREEEFIKDYKKNGGSFSYFNTAMRSFGVDGGDILKKYTDIGGTASKNIEDFYNEVYKNRVLPEREKIALFVLKYKEGGQNDFKFFHETLNDFGVSDTKEILSYYNDSVDQSFKLSSREFGLISSAKAELVSLQEKIIADAIEAGLEVPSNLSRLVSPSDKIKDETINPQKIKMIASFDFAKGQVKHKGESFDASGVMSGAAKSAIDEALAKEIKNLYRDIDNSVGFANVAIIKNNGFSFDRMKEWALYSGENDIINPQKAMSVAITALKQCNKLVECGILQSDGGKNFTFTSPRAREILFENQGASYNALADIVIKEHSITFVDTKEKPLNRELFDAQKAEFEEFLDAQIQSYYIPQGLGMKEFEADAGAENSQEFQRFRDLYPELKKGIDFKSALSDFIEKEKFVYVRQNSLDLSSKDFKSELEKLWKEAQTANKAVGEDSPKEKEVVQGKFINLSAVRFNGIEFEKLRLWGEGAVKNKSLTKSAAEAFIAASLKQGEKLVEAGLMVKNEKSYDFVDSFAKETLFKGYDLDIAEIARLNRGEKRVRVVEDVDVAHEDGGQKVGFLGSVGLSAASVAVAEKLSCFNYSWRESGDEKYRSMMAKVEIELKSDLKMSYIMDKGFAELLDREVRAFVGGKEVDASFFFDEFYDEMNELEKTDSKGVLEALAKRADSRATKVELNG
ncbi:MAG: hypothetical protein PHO62_07820 [Sulfurimonas sp.]|uniref:hypothetical protein n=1 Tax=Sulfurimonas sp. TaxID=2022749 RepID=UPI0026160734|nr:hypothetical protein [Sulfurimonas sp.]MDD5373314.1 hypothetical protein [Sulfurimonas sp.]